MSTEIESDITQMLKLTEKKVQSAITNMFKNGINMYNK